MSRIAGAGKMREDSGMSLAELPIQIDREKTAEFCRARAIGNLSRFGSVLREDFDPERQDAARRT
jgi:predicted nucleotidyltransferase